MIWISAAIGDISREPDRDYIEWAIRSLSWGHLFDSLSDVTGNSERALVTTSRAPRLLEESRGVKVSLKDEQPVHLDLL